MLEAGPTEKKRVSNETPTEETDTMSQPATLDQQHQALVHPDGSSCPDGCDAPPHRVGWVALDALMDAAGPLVNEAGTYSADTYRLRPLED
jgi:hypothetical protein